LIKAGCAVRLKLVPLMPGTAALAGAARHASKVIDASSLVLFRIALFMVASLAVS